jgi:hypothetical protein
MTETVKDKVEVVVEPTNKEFAEKNEEFRNACAGHLPPVEPTTRQASKWRNKKGKVYNYFHKGRNIVLNDV